MIAVADVVKPTSKQAIEELQAIGIQVVILTGGHKKLQKKSPEDNRMES